MPLYEYECDRCGHHFEKIQKFSDPLVDICPECGGPVHKQISSPAFHLKGTGWYATDYAKKDSGAPAKSDGGSKPSSDPKEKSESKSDRDGKTSTSETKPDAKPDAKPESKPDTKSDTKTDSTRVKKKD